MSHLISIVVPVYNISKYIEKCLRSLLCQSIENIEIIVVDDGSTDNSGKICDNFAKENPDKIRVLHTLNGGLSAARNQGIKMAKGEFIGFVDGDDWVEPKMYETLYSLITSYNADLSACALQYNYTEENICVDGSYNIDIATQEELFDLLINNRNVLGFVCNKLFKTEIVKAIFFDETLYSSEDIDFCAKYAQKSNRIAYCDSILYHYRQRKDSMTGEIAFSFRKLSVIRAYERLIPIYKQFNNSNTYVVERYLLKQNLNVIGRLKISRNKDRELKKRLQSNVKSLWENVMDNPNNSPIEKLNIVATRCMPASMLRIKQFILKHQ